MARDRSDASRSRGAEPAGSRVEFVDVEPARTADTDLLTVGGPDDDHGHRRRARLAPWLAAAAVLVLLATALVARVAAGGEPSAAPSASPSSTGRPTRALPPPVVGLVGLPRAVTTPREMVTATAGDVVWMRDTGGGIVRIEGGTVTAFQLLESQITAMAVSPDGRRLYVATGANRPAIQSLDATTLAPGPSQPLDGSIQALAVTIDAVWAASGSHLFRLDRDRLDALDTLELPGVVLTEHLRIQDEFSTSNQQYVVGLATGANDDGTTTSRFVRVDPLTSEVAFGPALPAVTDVATAQYLTWVTTWSDPPLTRGFASVLDPSASASTVDPLPTGSRIYDGGPGFAAFLSVAPDASVFTCHDAGGFATSEVDVAPALPDAVITGQVLRSASAFYVITDRGLVREGVGDCR